MEMKMSAQYPVVPIAAGTLARVFVALLAPVSLMLKAVARALHNRREAYVLARLDRHMLADIGITRSDVQDAFSTPLWEDPTALLRERVIERRMNRAGRNALNAPRWTGKDAAFTQPPTNRPARHAV
jgi:uncharacterized protein YjiS (DUF1127 family)